MHSPYLCRVRNEFQAEGTVVEAANECRGWDDVFGSADARSSADGKAHHRRTVPAIPVIAVNIWPPLFWILNRQAELAVPLGLVERSALSLKSWENSSIWSFPAPIRAAVQAKTVVACAF